MALPTMSDRTGTGAGRGLRAEVGAGDRFRGSA